MNTYIIRDKDAIIKLTGDNRHNRILLHLNRKLKEVKFESDYTLFELSKSLDYDHVIKVIRELMLT